MQTHDERRIALTPEPESRSVLDSIWFWITFGKQRDNRRNERQAKAADDNAPLREAEARRALSQPGVSQEALDKAARVLARIGKGEG
jgi:hypothetical protein